MKIVCAETVLLGGEAFSLAGECRVLPDREIRHEHLLDTDALIVRSKTKIDESLLHDVPVRFVGTATTGTDHMDTDWLDHQEIHWCAAPGCNANSVSEYLTAGLLLLGKRHQYLIEGKTIAIIGCGNVGKRMIGKAEALGMKTLRNDPPLAVPDKRAEYLPLEAVLTQADIVSLHVPFVAEGPWPTKKMAGSAFFKQLKPEALFINAARGSVCEYDTLISARQAGTVSQTILDVWDPEPAYRNDLLEMADIATPHIAGHSCEGKLNGTIACYNALCNTFGLEKKWRNATSLPPPECPFIEADAADRHDEAVLHEIVKQVCNIEEDDRLLRSLESDDEIERARHFDALRRNYPARREFHNTTVVLQNSTGKLRRKTAALGFKLG